MRDLYDLGGIPTDFARNDSFDFGFEGLLVVRSEHTSHSSIKEAPSITQKITTLFFSLCTLFVGGFVCLKKHTIFGLNMYKRISVRRNQ